MLFHPLSLSKIFNLLCLIIIETIDSEATTTTPATGYCQLGQDHTMCQYQNPACKVIVRGLNDQEKQAILDKHNDLRRGIAFGQPPASNMRKLVWDEELEAIAQRWAEQCNFDSHDTNRKKLDGTEVGQNNFGSVIGSFPSGIEHVQGAVQSWYDKSWFNPVFYKHYAQIVWAETDQLGCGKVVSQHKDGYKINIICNYAEAANLEDGSIFKVGQACSACPGDCDDGLCSSTTSGNDTSGCKTTNGLSCVFPFIYAGVEYSQCTTVENGETPWCSTETDKD